MKSVSADLAILVLILSVTGCQSFSPNPAPDQSDSGPKDTIILGDLSFVSLTQKDHELLFFKLNFKRPDHVLSWMVDWENDSGAMVYEISGDYPNIPGTITWDGRNNNGLWAPEGTYLARLTVDYGPELGEVRTESIPFAIIITPGSEIRSFSMPVPDFEVSSEALE